MQVPSVPIQQFPTEDWSTQPTMNDWSATPTAQTSEWGPGGWSQTYWESLFNSEKNGKKWEHAETSKTRATGCHGQHAAGPAGGRAFLGPEPAWEIVGDFLSEESLAESDRFFRAQPLGWAQQPPVLKGLTPQTSSPVKRAVL
ncbi:uncharacterized protein LOC116275307 [Papio anubis]|uniref:uncharacterized protein LOC116275307 n=1 Tax=Papio anubis TaxID=9555 RepID=UPI0012AD802F|nr:uncharacterized protein LOC116275307 [Papio anubis]XP_031523070.1 uncharacterized protein LOC116275307 [Papio anubis]XP_031523072.1 uncharacterized protein LOC116275307 [Papio anubis]XP_031523073.1 uncharacterized protein LOC116275307 [Papio anubis]